MHGNDLHCSSSVKFMFLISGACKDSKIENELIGNTSLILLRDQGVFRCENLWRLASRKILAREKDYYSCLLFPQISRCSSMSYSAVCES